MANEKIILYMDVVRQNYRNKSIRFLGFKITSSVYELQSIYYTNNITDLVQILKLLCCVPDCIQL